MSLAKAGTRLASAQPEVTLGRPFEGVRVLDHVFEAQVVFAADTAVDGRIAV